MWTSVELPTRTSPPPSPNSSAHGPSSSTCAGTPRQVNTPEIFRHLTDSTIHSAHFEAPVITMPDFRDVGYLDGAWNVAPAAPRLSARVVFLSGGGAISYAESTLGIVEAYRLGDIVGEASAGTNGNVNPFMLPGGYTIA